MLGLLLGSIPKRGSDLDGIFTCSKRVVMRHFDVDAGEFSGSEVIERGTKVKLLSNDGSIVSVLEISTGNIRNLDWSVFSQFFEKSPSAI